MSIPVLFMLFFGLIMPRIHGIDVRDINIHSVGGKYEEGDSPEQSMR